MADEEKKEDELELSEVNENELTATTQESNEENTSEQENTATTEENTENEDEVFVKKDKTPLIKKILIGVISTLGLILITGILLFAFGFFDEPEIESKPLKRDTNQAKIQNSTVSETPQEYNFNITDINSKKLNEKLALLTNKNLKEEEKDEELEKLESEKKILEEEKKKHQEAIEAEEKKLSEEKEMIEARKNELEIQKSELESLKQEALRLKEQLEKDKEVLEQLAMQKDEIPENEYKEDSSSNNEMKMPTNEDITKTENKMNQNDNSNEFLLLINVAKIKGELYKSYLDKISMINPNISLCRDDRNRIEIYYGPFESNKDRKTLFEKLQKNEFKNSYQVELTKEEFDKRCKY